MKLTTRFIYLFIFFLFSLSNVTAQKCKDFKQLYEHANSLGYVEYCSYIEKLETSLNDCLSQKHSMDVSLGDLYHDLGGMYFDCSFIQGPLLRQKSKIYIRSAIKIKSSHPDVFSHESISRSFYNFGLCLSHQERHASAIETLDTAIFYFENSPIPFEEFTPERIYNQLGDNYLALEDYHQAILYAQKAEKKLSGKEGENDLREKILALTTQSNSYRKLGDFKNAIDKLNGVKEILDNDDSFSIWRSAYVLYDFSLIHFEVNNFSASEEAINRSIKLYKTENYPDTTNLLLAYNLKVQLLFKTKKNIEAHLLATKTLQIAKKYYDSYHPIIGEIYTHLGEINASQKKYDQAFDQYQKAIQILIPSFNPQTINENPSIKKLIGDKKRLRNTLNLKAKTYQKKYKEENKQTDLNIAFDTYLKLDTLITRTRQSFKAVGSKYNLQKTIISIYEEAIEVALQLFNLTNDSFYQQAAYNFLVRNKAIILIEGLREEEVKFSSIPKELLKRESNLVKSVYGLEIDVYQAEQNGDSQKVAELRNELFEKKRAYEKLIRSFEENYPAYYRAKYNYYSNLKISEIQSKLEKDRTVIEFFVGEKNLFVSVLSKNTFKIITTELPDTFITLCQEFIEITRGEELIENMESRFSKVSYKLYELLLKKALGSIDHSINRITIIPDNIILKMPLDALLTEPFIIEKWYDEKIPFLFKKYATSQVYASSLLFETKKQKQIEKAHKNSLGLGIKYFDFTKQKPTNELDSITQKRMINGVLEYADDEVKGIKEILGGDILIDKEATKSFFLENASNYRIIHFASHAFGDENNPLGSSLIFAKTEKETDYQLRAAEIYTMDLNNTDLIVLSACQTNYGTIQEGEGMRTLTRAFAYAGCPSLIASSGNISDKSSKDIMIDFYKALVNEGHPKDVALQLAKINYLKNADGNTALPHLWAHLNVIGDVNGISSISTQKKWTWWLYISLALLFVFLLVKTKKSSVSNL